MSHSPRTRSSRWRRICRLTSMCRYPAAYLHASTLRAGRENHNGNNRNFSLRCDRRFPNRSYSSTTFSAHCVQLLTVAALRRRVVPPNGKPACIDSEDIRSAMASACGSCP